MMLRIAEFLFCDPGGWPRFSKADLERSPEEVVRLALLQEKNKPKHPWEGLLLFGLFLVLFPLVEALEFALRLYLLFLLPLICWVPASFLRPFFWHGLPANNACAWPMDLHWDKMRSYLGTVLAASTYWLMSIAIFLHCALTMRSGMGDQWNPLTRTIKIQKGGPFSEYVFFEMAMILSGVFAVTGLVWWPMIVFFEWLEARKKTGKQGVQAHA